MLRSRVGNTLWRLRMYRGRRFRGASRELFFRCAGRLTPELVTESDGMRFRVPTYDRAVGLICFAAGPPERGTLQRVLSILEARGDWRGADGSCFLDIGANIGTATVTALRKGGFAEAVCFEPLPDNHRLLLENLAGNGFADRVRTLNVALSDRDGEADFEISPNNSGDGRVRVASPAAGADAFGESAREVARVKLAKLDSPCEEGLVDLSRVSLAWLDAQGHEGQILAGASCLLRSSIPVVTEFWPYGLKRSGGKQLFVDAVRANYERMIDLGAHGADSRPVELEADRIEALFDDYEKSSFFDPGGAKASTDLLLL
jgi:FkbM family methyltransferase